MQPEPFFIDAAQVADLLCLGSADAVLRRRAELQARGFPAPVAFIRRPLKWSRASVLAWRDRAAGVPPPADLGGNVVALRRAGA